MRPTSDNPQTPGLDWRQALHRYAPQVVVCRHCNELLWDGVERAEGLCTFHLYTCGLGARLETAQRRLLMQLTRRIAQLRADTLPS